MSMPPVHLSRTENRNAQYKTVMCKNVMQGKDCPYGFKCQFAHSTAELRQRPEWLPERVDPFHQTCRPFRVHGVCPFGAKCKFSHVTVLPPPASPVPELHERRNLDADVHVQLALDVEGMLELSDLDADESANSSPQQYDVPFLTKGGRQLTDHSMLVRRQLLYVLEEA
tara:strand:- start:229 stop:735 length:507 start_codon:yes stop_codon:yes gene_type:complete